ncbi:hypothetical protein BU25DRAFT_422653 [Macroventuria anomochaeta]|uniref:Uncharacterized protein n=1 Tax=Macroventuria anomochaeta TaxID=301207 RepID=A0ACB6RXA2_9PLEO|nr:uncharacterized protein BU25DRAFT_422653 [Macroventuria anomochaeta]KAF2626506.1 hypothetical protein BU25DRAFT_422653 [Macroventuria anomochaeta]
MYREDGFYYLLTAEEHWSCGPLPRCRGAVNKGGGPIIESAHGKQVEWYLPASKDIPGSGLFIDEPDIIDFAPNSTLSRHFGFWRWPDKAAYTFSPPGHPGILQLKPSPASITAGYKNYTAGCEVANYTLTMRCQSDAPSQFSVDISFCWSSVNCTQREEVEDCTAVVLYEAKNSISPHLRSLVSGLGSEEKNNTGNIPAPYLTALPDSWLNSPIRLIIRAENETHHVLFAASSAAPRDAQEMGRAPVIIVSGGDGPFTGKFRYPNRGRKIAGRGYATSNHGNDTTPSYVSRWYQGLAQAVNSGVLIQSHSSQV